MDPPNNSLNPHIMMQKTTTASTAGTAVGAPSLHDMQAGAGA